MINAVQSAYNTQSIGAAQNSRSNEQVQSQTQKSGDCVSISESGKLLAQIDSFFSGLNIPYTPGQSISVDDLKTGLEKSTRELNDNITTMFLQNGISTDPPVELTSDSEGNIKVQGDHPHKEEIEQLFADNPDLANDFRGVSGLSSFVEAADEHLEFAKAYEKNPSEAIARFGHLFDNFNDEEFSMIIGKNSGQNTSAET